MDGPLTRPSPARIPASGDHQAGRCPHRGRAAGSSRGGCRSGRDGGGQGAGCCETDAERCHPQNSCSSPGRARSPVGLAPREPDARPAARCSLRCRRRLHSPISGRRRHAQQHVAQAARTTTWAARTTDATRPHAASKPAIGLRRVRNSSRRPSGETRVQGTPFHTQRRMSAMCGQYHSRTVRACGDQHGAVVAQNGVVDSRAGLGEVSARAGSRHPSGRPWLPGWG